MTPLGHASIGYMAGTILASSLPHLPVNTVLFGVLAGSVLLDLDLIYRFIQKGTKVFDKTIGEHRYFPTHTPIFSFLISGLISLNNFYFGVFFFLGCLLHLFLDMLFFPDGIMFFYPFSKKPYRFFTIKTHQFWAPKKISRVDDWFKNYSTSPLFWIYEIGPTIIALVYFLNEI